MIQINGKIYNSREFKPKYASDSDDYIKNDRKIASDNIQVKPLSISSIIFYKVKDNTEDKNEAIKFIQDIIYNQELITVVDVDNNVEYNDLFISTFNIQKKYTEGFLADIEFRYNPITETAVSGKNQYKGYSIRSERIIQKPLAKKQVPISNLPQKTIKSLLESGNVTIEDVLNFDNIPEGDYFEGLDQGILNNDIFDTLDLTDPDIINLNKVIDMNYLDFDTNKLTEGISEKIRTNVKGFNGIFELNPDGTFDIFNSLNEPIKMGQKILTDVELLANTIPGVDISLKLLPITQQASTAIFDISRLGKDFILNVNELKKDIGML